MAEGVTDSAVRTEATDWRVPVGGGLCLLGLLVHLAALLLAQPLLWALLALLVLVGGGLLLLLGIAEQTRRQTVLYAEARLQEMQNRLFYHEDLTRLMVDAQPRRLYVADGEGHVWYINRTAAEKAGEPAASLTGRTLLQIYGTDYAARRTAHIREALASRAPVITTEREKVGHKERFVHVYHIPLPDHARLKQCALVTEDDITSVLLEQRRQETMLRQIIDALVAVVDRRDPYAAGHSWRTGQVARALAQAYSPEPSVAETAGVAGSLMNFGKVLVPRSILTKSGVLSADELRQVREAILTSADILSLIPFELPVVQTLRQVLERYDGTGLPDRRRAEDIVLAARIVALANAFVALVSDRAHRAGLDVVQAMKVLGDEAGKAYDPRLVQALAQLIENAPERIEWLATLALERTGTRG